ncbi:MAG: EVE domain-containing protein [Elusimicrobia bacterium]|nr:EVE domain-containing protein [Elusimicrobiota bacterium]
MRTWLMKTEPDVFSIDDLKKKRRAPWDGVRNYQARNFMREMKVGDVVLFYHSSTEPPGVAGLARVCEEAHPDPTAWDRKSDYYDPRSTKDKPVWFLVDVEFLEKFPSLVTLEEIKADPHLAGMLVARRGMRLSVQPVERAHFDRVCELGRRPAAQTA